MIFNSKFKIQDSKFGFTLIELLVVIAIIGVLSAIVYANFVGIRQRGRDSQRKSDLRQIQTALELFRSDQGYYPDSISNCGASFDSGPNNVYLKKVPCDPSGTSYWNTGRYSYTVPTGSSSDANTYTLAACLENTNDSDPSNTASPQNPSSGCSSNFWYVLTNP